MVRPTFRSITYEGLKAGNEITVEYETSDHFSAYFDTCLVLNDENYPSSTCLVESPSLFGWYFTYQTKTTLVHDVDPGTKCFLKIYNHAQACDHYVTTLQGKAKKNFFK
jgi:hypothetical protein